MQRNFQRRVSEYQHDLISQALNHILSDDPEPEGARKRTTSKGNNVEEEEDYVNWDGSVCESFTSSQRSIVSEHKELPITLNRYESSTTLTSQNTGASGNNNWEEPYPGTGNNAITLNRYDSTLSHATTVSSISNASNVYVPGGNPELRPEMYYAQPAPAPKTGPNGTPIVHDISFLQEFQHLFTKGCQIGTLQFKHTTRDYVLPASMLTTQVIGVGKILVVKSHLVASQIEIGILVKMYTLQEYYAYKAAVGRSQDPDENYVGLVIRIASHKEKKRLPMKHAGEQAMLGKCQDLAMAHQLPIDITGVEFQFDGLILFVYYTCDVRIDYRRFVYDLIKECNGNSRIVMKRTNNLRPFIPNQLCANSLCTGRKYVEDEDMHKHIPADPNKYIPSELLNF